MFRKLLCWLGSHIWIVSHEKNTIGEITCSGSGKNCCKMQIKDVTYEIQKCLCCNKEKRKII